MPNPVPAFRESARRPPRWSGRRHRTPAIRSELSRCQPCSAGRQHHRYVLDDRRTRSKTLEVIREIIPSVRRVAVLPNSTDPFTKSFLKQIGIGAQIQGLEIQVIMIKGADEPIAAFASIKTNAADAVIVQPSLPRIFVPLRLVTSSAVLFLFNVIDTKALTCKFDIEFSHSLDPYRMSGL
jgi:hypothetical protein